MKSSILYRSYFFALGVALSLVLQPVSVRAQLEDLRIFGYAQTLFYLQDTRTQIALSKISPRLQDIDRRDQSTTFSLQQLNVMFNKPFAEKFNVFLNFEYTLSYSSGRDWGSFSVEEAWAAYDHADWLTVKAGLLLPTFNNLNDIKNRTALLPYLFRPIVYESNLAGFLAIEDFLPERAFVQLNGFVPLGGAMRMDYAVFTGNSETSYVSSNRNNVAGISGEDSSPFKMVGGRVGIRNSTETFKTGISATFDRDNRRDTTKNALALPFDPPIAPLGDVPRVRLGGDISLSLGNLAFEAEYIGIRHTLPAGVNSELLDKDFFYANLLYNFTDQFYAYGNYALLRSGSSDATGTGFDLNQYGFGAGWRVNQAFIPKIQYTRTQVVPGGRYLTAVDVNYFYVGLSIIF